MFSCQKCYANSITLFPNVDTFSKRIILWNLEKVNLLIWRSRRIYYVETTN